MIRWSILIPDTPVLLLGRQLQQNNTVTGNRKPGLPGVEVSDILLSPKVSRFEAPRHSHPRKFSQTDSEWLIPTIEHP
jgi:hypothetical protein